LVPLGKLPHAGISRIRIPATANSGLPLNCCCNDEISLVTLVGKAGTGKTLLAIAAGLQKVTDERTTPAC
jgi:PhoH-like ATPase